MPIGRGINMPRKVTEALQRDGIVYDDGHYSKDYDTRGVVGVYFTAWRRGKVVALLFLAKGSKTWKVIKENI